MKKIYLITLCLLSFFAYETTAQNTITGKIFRDVNANGVQDTGESPVRNAVVEILSGPYYAVTDSFGVYTADVPIGSYTINSPDYSAYYTATPATHTATFVSTGQTDTGNDFAFVSQPNVNDLQIHLAMNKSRPGYGNYGWISYKNVGTLPQSGTIKFVYDNRIEINRYPTGDTHVGNIITWNYTNLLPGERNWISFWFDTPATIPLGTELEHEVTIDPVAGDAIPEDNVSHLKQIVVNSMDPNDKQVSPEGDLLPKQITKEEPLTYTIRFQNKGTASAINIAVKDTLSEKLNVSSFETVAASHPYKLSVNGKGIVQWSFDNIYLPEESADEPNSHGFITYRIKPKKDLVIGDKIENKAYIFFDFNEPVITNTTLNTVNKLRQEIIFETLADKTFGDSPVALAATNSANLPVSFNIVSGPATVAGSTLTITGAGKITIKATQAGNDDYNAAPERVQTICVNPAKPIITQTGTEISAAFTLSSSSTANNQWLKDGEMIPNATNQNYNVTQAGSYAVKVTVDGCSNMADAVTLTANETATISAYSRIYPNPGNNIIQVEYTSANSKFANVTVYNLLGVKIAEKQLENQGQLWQTQLDVSHYAKGRYLLIISNGNGQSIKSFIKK